MTDFELASLAIRRVQMWVSVATATIAFIAAIIALWGLRGLIRQIGLGQLNTLLTLEQDMSRRRDRVGEIAVELHKVKASPAYQTDRSILDPIVGQFNEAKESYFNSLDRLCFCVIRNAFSEDDLRSDYRDVLKDAINTSPEQFGPGSPYRNILKLYDRWADT